MCKSCHERSRKASFHTMRSARDAAPVRQRGRAHVPRSRHAARKFVVICHPISSASDAQLEEYARAAIQQSGDLLLRGGAS